MSFISVLFRAIVPRRPDAREVAALLERAWIDNVEAPERRELGAAVGWARAAFNDNIGAYVREHFKRTGKFPVGWHWPKRGADGIYFAPRLSLVT